MTGRIQDKVALITGAARGQGRSHAIRLAEEGADIIAVDICKQIDSVSYPLATSDDLAETARLVQATGRQIVAVEADVRDLSAMRLAVDKGVAELGRLDIVAANAGIHSSGLLADLSETFWQDVIDTNLTGVWHTVKVAIPHLLAGQRGGSIIITSSRVGMSGGIGNGHYIAAKTGLVGLMRCLALELAPDMVRVNSIHPTQVPTDMIMNPVLWAKFCPDIEEPTIDDFTPRSQAGHALPIPWVEAVDISNALLFLASDEGRYITGVALPVDAGSLIGS
jgi:(+)-trans-carveol dehydrogenase